MYFNWVGLIFWVLIGMGLLLIVYGLWKKHWRALLISGIVLLLPMLYFVGTKNWFRLLALIPFIAFIFAYHMKKRTGNT